MLMLGFYGKEQQKFGMFILGLYGNEQQKFRMGLLLRLFCMKVSGACFLEIFLANFNLFPFAFDQVPIYIISSATEELLAFLNVIPEWLCKQRQEKLFWHDRSHLEAVPYLLHQVRLN